MRAGRVELGRARQDAARAAAEADRARTEAAVLRGALEMIPLGVVVYDAEGQEVTRNRPATALVDARHGDALAAHLLASVVQDARRRGAAVRTLELEGPPARILEVRAERLRLPGSITATVAVIEDVSERHHLDAVRRDFVANVSHELRTPIGALGALAEALGHEEDPEVVRRLGVRIGAEAERAAGLITDLLDLSRVEGARPPGHEAVAVAQLVAESVARVRALADERGITIRERPGIPGSLTVAGDAAQLVSALTNLLDNAIKYSDPGSPVDVEVDSDERAVTVRVRDRGLGIPARDHERIFERFYRVDRARSRETGGTGLGLAIVRHVAINHGGRVTVESREGEGSCFSLVLRREAS